MSEEQILDAVRRQVRIRLSGQGAGHGFDHIHRVVVAARQIHADVGGNLFVIELAALLHDIGDAKFNDGVERSGEFSREILGQLDLSDAVIDEVVHIVDNLSFRKRETADALSLEGQIVQDADRLDALGAIGIVRTIEYGAVKGQPFYDASDPEGPSGVKHFDDKLFRLRELMNTEVGRRLAAQREEFMRTFLNEFFGEYGLQREASAND
ncbi:HD domain-containing protein [Rhodopirellula sp. MGV]|uniref:HD domain-containing protein n=1 Tax=Rhodopirellula sp. MGV TaxID=2023130 RepID=UPI000B95D51D|nr:HD domain-containing protein [Rhodopirellula sp. MGV]OYP30426.1 metal-dependent phosphohydrolase [Rhodopirellula sp. MGV]PNY34849.1 HD domain-containing protein [Rhodopirellula baltica]